MKLPLYFLLAFPLLFSFSAQLAAQTKSSLPANSDSPDLNTVHSNSGGQAAKYVGAKACTECHAKETESWKGSHHDLAMQKADSKSVLGDFSNINFLYNGITRDVFWTPKESRFCQINIFQKLRNFLRRYSINGGKAYGFFACPAMTLLYLISTIFKVPRNSSQVSFE